MIDFKTAQATMKNTFDSAFSKNIGTKEKRVNFARMSCNKASTDHATHLCLLLWAVDYCGNWTKQSVKRSTN